MKILLTPDGQWKRIHTTAKKFELEVMQDMLGNVIDHREFKTGDPNAMRGWIQMIVDEPHWQLFVNGKELLKNVHGGYNHTAMRLWNSGAYAYGNAILLTGEDKLS